MQLPERMARFNRRVTNPVLRMWAGHLPMMGNLEHVGRTSGKTYCTPLIVFPTRTGVAIHLTYGPDRDWLKNLRAAGGADLEQHGKTFRVVDPRVLSKAQAAPEVTGPSRFLFARLPFEQTLLLTRAS